VKDEFIPKTKVEAERLAKYRKAVLMRRLNGSPDMNFADWIRGALDERAAADLLAGGGLDSLGE